MQNTLEQNNVARRNDIETVKTKILVAQEKTTALQIFLKLFVFSHWMKN